MQQSVDTLKDRSETGTRQATPARTRRSARRGRSVSADASSTRKCIVTGANLDCGDLIRFAISPTGDLAPDLYRKLGGRGVWVTATRAHVEQACAKKAFDRGFGTKVTLPDDLPDMIDRLLLRSALDSLAMARKAGRIITGQTKLNAAIRAGKVGLVIEAADGAADGARKTRSALMATGLGDEVRVIRLFTSTQMSLALGQSNVVHAGVPSGGLSGAIIDKSGRLSRYRDIGQAPKKH
jgi:uncharacterized protein